MKTEHTMLDVRNIETRFGKSVVHRSISFSLNPGSVVALIGGSGSGKSVLLKEIIGLLRPTAGSVTLFGCNIWEASVRELEAVRSRFGVLFQNGALFSALSVGDNVAIPLREQSSLPEAIIRQLVELRLCLSGLDPEKTISKMPAELSGGMRKRVALARALALEPELLFLDEPTSGLDPIHARAFDKLIRTLCDSTGISVFMVTHDLDTILSICDRVIAIGEGTIIADGTVPEIRALDVPWIKEYFAARIGDR